MGVKTTTMGIKAHGQLTGLTIGDDHTQYQKESEKDAVSGYAGLDASSKLGVLQMSYTRTVAASAVLQESNDAEIASYFTTSYAKQKEFTALTVSGTIRIMFDILGSAGDIMYAKVYKGGVAVGTEQNDNTGAYVEKSEDIAGWSVGDIVEVWVKRSTAVGSEAKIRNFRLYGDITMVAKPGLI